MRRPVLLAAVYYLLLGLDATGTLRLGLLAALLHECGHVLAWLWLTHSWPLLELSLGGIALRQTSPLSPGRELALALAGPGANLALALGALGWMQVRASHLGYRFACANLLLAGLNLLPVGKLDGRYLWIFLREKLQSGRE